MLRIFAQLIVIAIFMPFFMTEGQTIGSYIWTYVDKKVVAFNYFDTVC